MPPTVFIRLPDICALAFHVKKGPSRTWRTVPALADGQDQRFDSSRVTRKTAPHSERNSAPVSFRLQCGDETSRQKDGDFATLRSSDNIPDAFRKAVFAMKLRGVDRDAKVRIVNPAFIAGPATPAKQ
jgi:hypothetical protein